MIDPLFWLGLSFLLVAVSIIAVLVAALPALQEVARAARSAEKLFDTLRRDLPPTLEAIRLTGLEISDLTDDVSDSVKKAGQVVQQVDQSVDSAKKQAQKIQLGTRSVFVGVKAAWKSLTRPSSNRRYTERLLESKTNRGRDRQSEEQLEALESPIESDEVANTENYPPLLESYDTYNTHSQKSRQKPRNASNRQTDEDFYSLDSED